MSSDEGDRGAEAAAISQAQDAPQEVFVVYADVPGIEGGPVVLPGFEASDLGGAEAVMRRANGEFRRQLDAMGTFSAEQVASATFRLKDVE